MPQPLSPVALGWDILFGILSANPLFFFLMLDRAGGIAFIEKAKYALIRHSLIHKQDESELTVPPFIKRNVNSSTSRILIKDLCRFPVGSC